MALFEGFLHPFLLWGTALASVPLAIHILNRRRHKSLAWGAMRFVLAAHKRTRRRVQLENWLLLFLRMAAVVALALAIARPFIGKESPLAPLTEKRREMVLILDDSGSTGYRDVRSVHEAEIERARAILAELDGTRGDRVRLVLAAHAPQVLASHSPEDALAALSTVSAPRDEPLDLAALLAEVVDMAEEDAGESGQSALEVRLLTDLQRNTFLAEAGASGDGSVEAPAPIRTALDRLRSLNVELWVEDLGAPVPQPANTGIVSIRPLQGPLVAGLTTEIAVGVQNFGATGRAGVRVALTVDDQRQPSQKLDVGARSGAQAVFPVVFAGPGYHALEAEIEGDRLTLDDRRAVVLYTPAPRHVLLVNGAPSDDPARDEVAVLRAALEPPDDGARVLSAAGAYAPFLCEETTPAAFGEIERGLEGKDVVVLANVASISGQTVEHLERWVARGGCLVFTMGDRTADPSALEALNARFWRADASGLLPARLVRHVAVASRYGSYFRAADFAEEHPALTFFSDERWKPFLTELPIYEFVASDPVEGAHVLARLDDEQKSPLLVERAYERGRVFLWSTSIDGDWNVLPQSPSTLIPLVHELLRYGAGGTVPTREVAVGGSLELELTSFPRGAALVAPDGARTPLDSEPRELMEGLWAFGPIGPLARAGLWHVEVEGQPATPVACQLDVREGDLERIAPEELTALHPGWRLYRPGEDDGGGQDDPQERGELWRWLAGATLVLLLAETLWAAWIGRGRRLT